MVKEFGIHQRTLIKVYIFVFSTSQTVTRQTIYNHDSLHEREFPIETSYKDIYDFESMIFNVGSRIFPRGEGAPIPKLGLFCKIFAENYIKMKEFGTGGTSLAPP